MRLNIVFPLLCTTFIHLSVSERLHEQIYSAIEGGAACFRRLNGTHQVGCSTSDKGAIGVVYMVNNISDAQWLALDGNAGPYVAIISTALFHGTLELFMDHSHQIAGILLYDATGRTAAFSQESKCPNEYSSGPGSQCSSQGKSVWNDIGTGLIRKDIPFPIFYLPASRSEEITKIQKCYERYNLDREKQLGQPVCSVQLNTFMWAAVNSVVCRRRSAANALLTPTKVCDPLGDKNVYYSLFPREKNAVLKQKVILVTARIDTATLFDGVSPGAASSVVGMVTLMTAATTLSKMIPAADSAKYDINVLWTLLNGEAFDYIGSQRVAYDLGRGAWPADAPLTPAQIKLHIEIGQIGGSLPLFKDNSSWPLYAFAPNDAGTKQNIQKFLADIVDNAKNSSVSLSQQYTNDLPPSSLHSFRRILSNVTENGELPELVFTDHNRSFSNMYYHSVLDDFDKIEYIYHNISIGSDGAFIPTDELLIKGNMTEKDVQVKIARLATVLSRALYQQVVGAKYDGNDSASAHLVDEMLYCFLQNKMCRLMLAADFGQASAPEEVSARPAPLYVGVTTSTGHAAAITGHLFALLTGKHLALNKTKCDASTSLDYSYYWLKGWNHSGICIETNMNFSEAISPAFIVPGYDFQSGVYSTWTESVWQIMWARVFVSAGGGGANAALVAGGLITALAAALTFWLRRHVDTIFANAPLSAIGSHDAAPGILRTVNC